MGGRGDFRFVCPECAESITVNAYMREALIDHGCVVCGTRVSVDAFSTASVGN